MSILVDDEASKLEDPEQIGSDTDAQTLSITAVSTLLRTIGSLSLVYPHLIPWPISTISVPISYLCYLWLWLGFDQRRYGRDVIEVREVVKVVESGGSKMRRLNGLDKEVHVRREGEVSGAQNG